MVRASIKITLKYLPHLNRLILILSVLKNKASKSWSWNNGLHDHNINGDINIFNCHCIIITV